MPRLKQRFRPIRKCKHPDCDVYFKAPMRKGKAPAYCSLACAKDYWSMTHPESVKESERRRKLKQIVQRQEVAKRERPPRECASRRCQRTFQPRTKFHIYCSNRCRQRVLNQRRGHTAPDSLVLCPGCDTYFEPLRKGHLYCTTRCSDHVRRPPGRNLQEKQCRGCGKTFVGRRNREFCTERCGHQSRCHRYDHKRRKPKLWKRCQWERCGQLFQANRVDQVYCSHRHGQAARYHQQRQEQLKLAA